MFSPTKFVVAGAIVALFGVYLLARVPTQQGDGVPGAAPNGPGTFSPTGSLAQPRHGHSATLLPDGRVLVVGGDEGLNHHFEVGTTTAEVWDPETGAFSPTGSLSHGRLWHTATLLPDGRVLVVGGWGESDRDIHASAEFWDPSTGTFSPAGSLAQRRESHTATLLPDGRVFIVGGSHQFPDPLDSAEVWDPATSTFSPAGSAAMDGIDDTALLPDDRVFVVGSTSVLNEDGDHEPRGAAEVWDPATSTFSSVGSPAMDWMNDMNDVNHLWTTSATLLPDGRVLLVGSDEMGSDDSTSAEIWDPTTSTFSPAGSPLKVEWSHSATLLPDGRVLIVGGPGDAPATAEVWDPTTASSSPTASPAETRLGHTATLLRDGRVLVVGGGYESADGVHASAEIWSPSNS